MTNVAKISKKPFVGFSHDFFVTIVGKFTRKKTEQHMPHYLSIKEGSLLVFFFFLFSTLRSPNTQHRPHCDLENIGKPSMSTGALRSFHNVQTYGARVIEH
jgi:hypothetical protein